MTVLTPTTEQQLLQPTSALHVWSDVFPSNGDLDPDALLTTDARHLRLQNDHRFPIEGAAYGVELVCQLQDAINSEIEAALRRAREHGRDPHPNIVLAQRICQTQAVRVIANCAPRDGENPNGPDFYLAITDNGVEIYATPLELLKHVRHRVLSLYRIPTQGHPLFDGDSEQFRSSIIARTCECLEHLEPIYQVGNREELQERLAADPEFSPIPQQTTTLEVAYVDRFGNIRARTPRNELVRSTLASSRNGEALVGARVNGVVIPAHLTQNLTSIPGGKLGIFQNIADGNQTDDEAGYWELALRWPDGGQLGDEPSAHQAFEHPPIGTPIQICALAH